MINNLPVAPGMGLADYHHSLLHIAHFKLAVDGPMGVEHPCHIWHCTKVVAVGPAVVLLELFTMPGVGDGGAGEEVGVVGAGLGPPGPPQAGRLPGLLQAGNLGELTGMLIAQVLGAQDYPKAPFLLELQLATELH